MSEVIRGGRLLRRGVAAAREEAATTPGHLRLLSVLIATGAGLLWLGGSSLMLGTRGTLDRAGSATVPDIVRAQQIHSLLAEADRAAATAFLSGGIEIVEPRTEYEIDIAIATHDLEQAAEQNQAGSQATRQIQAIDGLLTQYVGLVETARANNRQGFPVAVAYLRDASQLMHRAGDGILARVDALGALNVGDLADEQSTLTLDVAAVGAFLAVAAVLFGLLLHAQVFLARRFRRRLNDGIVAGVLLVAVLSVWMTALTAHTVVAGTVAEQAYTRLNHLWLARSVANDADGNVSLYLIGLGESGSFDQAFGLESAQLVDRPLTDGLVADAGRGRVGFNGLLADELREADFPGEREAALRTLRSFQRFQQAVAAVTGAVAAGDDGGAAAVALGTSPGQLSVAFGELDEALGDAIAIDRDQFDAAFAGAGSGLGLDFGLPFLALAIAVLTFWGLEPRIAEYRA